MFFKTTAARQIPVYASTLPRLRDRPMIILGVSLAALLIAALNVSDARAQSTAPVADPAIVIAQSAPPAKGERPGRPPREAMEACAEAAAKSACSFSVPTGETITGTCTSPEANVPLACTPAVPPQNG